MYQYKGLEDTIAAIATPAGQGGIGIVRISGKDAIAVADAVLRLKSKASLAACPSHSVHYGWVTRDSQIIDEVMVTLMRGPKSYTAEDVVEISCHGGMTVVRCVLDAVLAAGSRLADPGEFTKRAFLNGRIDLAQAEAVADIINAKTQAFVRQSQYQLEGQLSQKLQSVREESIQLYTMVEALINFPEDGIDAQDRRQILERLQAQQKVVDGFLSSADSGRLLKNGIRIVLCGKPNAGKSSLLNALLKEERAIVTSIAGTTRDVLEETAQLKGLPISLVDTAGILKPRDLIEEEAIKRSHLYINSADLVLLVLDHSLSLEEEDILLLEKLKGARVLGVVNKTDLEGKIDILAVEKFLDPAFIIKICALQESSVQNLESKIIEIVSRDKNLEAHGLIVSNIRHIKALEETSKNLQDACRLMNEGSPFEFVSEEIKAAVNQLDGITGRNIDEDLLELIFSQFCIGK